MLLKLIISLSETLTFLKRREEQRSKDGKHEEAKAHPLAQLRSREKSGLHCYAIVETQLLYRLPCQLQYFNMQMLQLCTATQVPHAITPINVAT